MPARIIFASSALYIFFLFSGLSCQKKEISTLRDLFPLSPCLSPRCLVMIGHSSCPISEQFRSSFFDPEVLPKIEKRYAVASSLFLQRKYPTPFFVWFEEGRPVDVHVGIVHPAQSFAKKANQLFFHSFLLRNGLASGVWTMNRNAHLLPKDKDLSYRSLKFLELPFARFSNRLMRHMVIFHARFPSAQFDSADLTGSLFSHVDLRGASFRHAILQGVLWNRVICPDGSKSHEHHHTCEGHLLSKETPTSTPAPSLPQPGSNHRFRAK